MKFQKSTEAIREDIRTAEQFIKRHQSKIASLSLEFTGDELDDYQIEEEIQDKLDCIKMWREYIDEALNEISSRTYTGEF